MMKYSPQFLCTHVIKISLQNSHIGSSIFIGRAIVRIQLSIYVANLFVPYLYRCVHTTNVFLIRTYASRFLSTPHSIAHTSSGLISTQFVATVASIDGNSLTY